MGIKGDGLDRFISSISDNNHILLQKLDIAMKDGERCKQ